MPRYEAVQEDKVYKVVLPSYLVTGGDGFSMIRDEKIKHDSGEWFGQMVNILVITLVLTLVITLSITLVITLSITLV